MQDKVNITLQSLQDAAMRENWEEVEKTLPLICDKTEALTWAKNNIASKDPNVRDLAVSILEISSLSLDAHTISTLSQYMQSDPNPYVRFRSAFALFKHGERADRVMAVIQQATTDQDVAETARMYLDQDAA